jgi:iron complex outermembrane recepter protein
MLTILVLAATAPEPALQPATERDREIIVTGERTARTRHETASSVAVLEAGTIDVLAAPDRLDQLLQLVPNVQLGSGGEAPTIRGQDATGVVRDLPAFLGGIRPRSTVQIDGRPATYYELAFGLTSVWDVERVEVFRSPQTTTQGRNSIGGAIFVETAEPTFDWSGRTRAIVGDFATRQASAVVSGPLASNGLAVRVAGNIRHSRTSSDITNAARGVDPNSDESELLRIKLRAEPAGIAGLRLGLTYSHGRSQAPQIEGIEEPFRERRNPSATYGIFRIVVDSLTGRVAYQPSNAFEARFSASTGHARVRRFAPTGLGEARIVSRDSMFEAVIAGRPSPAIHLTGGLNNFRGSMDQTIDVSAQQFGTGTFTDKQESFGVFGETRLDLAARLSVTAGFRYQRDRQVRQGAMTGGIAALPVDYDETFAAFLPKLAIAYDLSPDIRVGFLAQRAFNPGGMTINTSRFRVDRFAAETLWAYEVFARARLAGGKLTLAGNLFRYEMQDAQRSQAIAFVLPDGQVAFATEVANAPRAWSMGLEFDAQWRPTARLNLAMAIGLLDTRITRTLEAVDPMLGKEFQRSPHFTGTASVEWRPVEPVRLSAQLKSGTDYFSDDLETAARKIGGSTTVDVRAAASVGAATVFAYARNLFDAFHLTYRFSPASGLAAAGDPREVGLGIEARF